MSREYTTEEKQEYYQQKLREFSGTGDCHAAYMIDEIGGYGEILGPVDPPVLSFGQDMDPYYQQYFHNWDEVDAMIKQIEEEATKAWGPRKVK
jgi:hypothetical protein